MKNNGLTAAPPGPPITIPVLPGNEYAMPTPGGVNPLVGGGVELRKNESLLLTVFNIVSGLTLRISGRLFRKDGTIQSFQFDYTPTSAGAASTTQLNVRDGWLESIVIIPTAGTPKYGETSVEVGVLYGDLVSRLQQTKIILSGYVTSTNTLYDATQASPVTGQGVFEFVGMGGAGTATYVIPTNRRSQFHYARATLATSAVAANRTIFFQSRSPSGVTLMFQCTSQVLQPASTTYLYEVGDFFEYAAIFAPAPGSGVDGVVRMKMPEITLNQGDGFIFGAFNLQAGDSTNAEVQFESWVTS